MTGIQRFDNSLAVGKAKGWAFRRVAAGWLPTNRGRVAEINTSVLQQLVVPARAMTSHHRPLVALWCGVLPVRAARRSNTELDFNASSSSPDSGRTRSDLLAASPRVSLHASGPASCWKCRNPFQHSVKSHTGRGQRRGGFLPRSVPPSAEELTRKATALGVDPNGPRGISRCAERRTNGGMTP
jgi:hypothetical protein